MPKKIKPVIENKEAKKLEIVLPKSIDRKDFKEFIELYSNSLGSIGEFLVKMGSIEKKTGLNFNDVSKIMLEPDTFDKLVGSMPPDIIGLFLKIIYRAASLNKINMNELSADEKIRVGTNIRDLAMQLNDLFRVLEESADKGKK
jgi:hypothetical protein